MERFLNGLLSRLVRDLVGRGVDWAFDRATRRKGQPESTDVAATGQEAPVSEDLAEKARQLERMMRRIGH
jgi:hypothetical protein